MSDSSEKGRIEYRLLRQYSGLAGVDEVGRGCLAGPVYAAAVVLDYERLTRLDQKTRNLIRDSKTLSARQRAQILPVIRDELALASCVAWSGPRDIEALGIVGATFEAMHKSLAGLSVPWQYLLIDGHRPLDGFQGPQEFVIKGDQLCYSIAAASILAKEARDQFMKEQADLYPGYGFESHVGYGTKKHLDALEAQGVCTLHRRNFAPVMKRARV